jgi:hypothetical protein
LKWFHDKHGLQQIYIELWHDFRIFSSNSKQINKSTMRNQLSLFGFIIVLLLSFGCSSNPLGKSVKEPFSGSKYESGWRFYRGVGKGASKMDGVAQSQSEMKARQSIAQQVQTHFEVVTDDYQRTVTGEHVDEAMMRFETLAREVTLTQLTDLRNIGSEKYLDDEGTYTVYTAFEVKKSGMYRHMKKQAKLDKRISEQSLKEIEALLELEIQKVEKGE